MRIAAPKRTQQRVDLYLRQSLRTLSRIRCRGVSLMLGTKNIPHAETDKIFEAISKEIGGSRACQVIKDIELLYSRGLLERFSLEDRVDSINFANFKGETFFTRSPFFSDFIRRGRILQTYSDINVPWAKYLMASCRARFSELSLIGAGVEGAMRARNTLFGLTLGAGTFWLLLQPFVDLSQMVALGGIMLGSMGVEYMGFRFAVIPVKLRNEKKAMVKNYLQAGFSLGMTVQQIYDMAVAFLSQILAVESVSIVIPQDTDNCPGNKPPKVMIAAAVGQAASLVGTKQSSKKGTRHVFEQGQPFLGHPPRRMHRLFHRNPYFQVPIKNREGNVVAVLSATDSKYGLGPFAQGIVQEAGVRLGDIISANGS